MVTSKTKGAAPQQPFETSTKALWCIAKAWLGAANDWTSKLPHANCLGAFLVT